MKAGISFVVPVRNGAAWIRDVIQAIAAQVDGDRPIEIIVVDDGSSDSSAEIVGQVGSRWPLRLIEGDGRGAAAAINHGLRAARFPLIAQIDQDVMPPPGWAQLMAAELDDPSVGAAQGSYVSAPGATLCARAMDYDLAQRYAAIDGAETDHVCTGNTVYRAEALRNIGLFDETFGYGYDNDVSYRLRAAGYRLRLCRAARSVHRWREGLAGYLVQQYGFGYGRVDLVAKYPSRFNGDMISPAPMMWHPILMLTAVTLEACALFASVEGAAARPFAVAGLFIVALLGIERLIAGVRAACRFRAAAPLVFPLLHLVRDLAWVAAIVIWIGRRTVGRQRSPAYSMRAE